MARILLIKLGALGDFVQATGAMAAIRAHHPDETITLLTTPGMVDLAESLPYFDEVLYDQRLPLWRLDYLFNLRRMLRGFDLVYDLQTNDRTAFYFCLAGKPAWSGIAKGCSLPHRNPLRNTLHTLDRLGEQLSDAGITSPLPLPNLTAARGNAQALIQKYHLTNPDVVGIIAGGAAHRPEKRWPHYATLMEILVQAGRQPVLIGGVTEADLLKDLQEECSPAINLCGQTDLPTLIDLLAQLPCVIGNDTGPMHIAAAVGTPGVVLFGHGSNPALCAPRSPKMRSLHAHDIATLTPQQVLSLLPNVA
jgi:ADP-heptose:LPS heptosyltransferase